VLLTVRYGNVVLCPADNMFTFDKTYFGIRTVFNLVIDKQSCDGLEKYNYVLD